MHNLLHPNLSRSALFSRSSLHRIVKNTNIVLTTLLFILVPANDLQAQIRKITDADLTSPTRKNAAFIQRYHIRPSQITIQQGNQQFLITILKKTGKNRQKYIVVHDSEDAAFDAGLRAIKHGGTLIALENHEERALYSYGNKKGTTRQDPNRMFYKDNPYWPVAQKILMLLATSPQQMVIALHNNKPGGNFRLDTIATWKNISIASHADKDLRSLVWIPGPTVNPDKKTTKEIAFYQKKKMNVVYEYVPAGQRGDGSMSVYFTQHGIAYRNIEVEAGIRGNRKSEHKSRRKQIRYLNRLRRYHGLK